MPEANLRKEHALCARRAAVDSAKCADFRPVQFHLGVVASLHGDMNGRGLDEQARAQLRRPVNTMTPCGHVRCPNSTRRPHLAPTLLAVLSPSEGRVCVRRALGADLVRLGHRDGLIPVLADRALLAVARRAQELAVVAGAAGCGKLQWERGSISCRSPEHGPAADPWNVGSLWVP